MYFGMGRKTRRPGSLVLPSLLAFPPHSALSLSSLTFLPKGQKDYLTPSLLIPILTLNRKKPLNRHFYPAPALGILGRWELFSE